MAITLVDIANEALDYVSAATIVSLDDPTPEAGIVSRAIQPVIDRVLSSYPWTKARNTITAYPYVRGTESQVGLPDNCLRVVHVDVAEEYYLLDRFTLCFRAIVTDPVKITYIEQTDVDKLDPLIRDLIALELAIRVAAKLTESPQRIAVLTRKAIQARKLAQAKDGKS